jgi:hypothetical protein
MHHSRRRRRHHHRKLSFDESDVIVVHFSTKIKIIVDEINLFVQ